MTGYIIRRFLYAFPILLGVNFITFMLFFALNTPENMARIHVGSKHEKPELIQRWIKDHGYDKPRFFNSAENGFAAFEQTIFYQKSIKLFWFDFGHADDGRDIGYDIRQRMVPSLMIAIPALVLGLLTTIVFALILAFFRASYIDIWGVFVCVLLMSISYIFYIIAGQYVVGKLLHLVPISGYDDGILAWKFVLLPLLVGVVAGLGGSTRFYRTIFLEELGKDYVRTAKAKGLSETVVLSKHVLRNAMIPIVTQVVVGLPLLFMGSLLTESFFGIPGLGSYTIDAIHAQDFSIVRGMVFLGSFLYIIGLLLTDIAYTLVDPRIRLS